MVKARLLSPFVISWALTSLPRLKAIRIQRLYRPESGRPEAYRAFAANPNTTNRLGPDPATIRSDGQKYTTALRLGTGEETEAILRRFTRSNVQHPTYKALAELGKAIKTLFLCRYLREETLRREIHEGLNVIEHWNGANDFVFFARRGELASNRTEDHELSMLSLRFRRFLSEVL